MNYYSLLKSPSKLYFPSSVRLDRGSERSRVERSPFSLAGFHRPERFGKFIFLASIMAIVPAHAGMYQNNNQPYNSYNPNNLGGNRNNQFGNPYNQNPSPVVNVPVAPKGFAALEGSVPQEIIEFASYFKDANISTNTRYAIKQSRGIFLIGQTGSGKTSVAKALSEELDCPFMYQSAAGITAEDIQKVFEAARKKAQSNRHGKTVLFLDDLDVFATSKTIQ